MFKKWLLNDKARKEEPLEKKNQLKINFAGDICVF